MEISTIAWTKVVTLKSRRLKLARRFIVRTLDKTFQSREFLDKSTSKSGDVGATITRRTPKSLTSDVHLVGNETVRSIGQKTR